MKIAAKTAEMVTTHPPVIPFHCPEVKKNDDSNKEEQKDDILRFNVTIGGDSSKDEAEWPIKVCKLGGDAEEHIRFCISFESICDRPAVI